MSRILQFKSNKDVRGTLTAIECHKNIPFDIKRVFYIKPHDNFPRGFHAHKECEQVLVTIQGKCDVEIKDGVNTHTYHLDADDYGLYLPINNWLKMENFSDDCIILVLCSTLYDENEYMRNYGDFLVHVDKEKKKLDIIKSFDLAENTKSIRLEINDKLSSLIDINSFVLGAEVSKFEKDFAAYNKSNYCVGLSNGTSALICALKSLNLPPDSEIIVPANTYVAAPIAIDYCNLKIKVVDIDDSLNIDLDQLETDLTINMERTKVVLVVHLYGNCCDMDKLLELKTKYGFYLIEDAAQAHGSEFNNRKLGTFGDVGCFSFYPSKNLGSFGEGGAIVTNDINIYQTIRLLRNYGCEEKYKWLIKGSNERMHNIQAGVLNIKLKYLDTWNAKRARLAGIYNDRLGKLKNVTIPKMNATLCNYHLYVVLVDDREDLINHLKANQIETAIHYPQTFYKSQAYKELNHLEFSADGISKSILSLPMYPELPIEKAEKVCTVMEDYYKS